MLHRGFGSVKLDNGNKLLLIGRPAETWLVIDSDGELLGDFDPKIHGAGREYLGNTSLAKLSDAGMIISGSLGVAVMEKMALDDATVYLPSRAGKRVP